MTSAYDRELRQLANQTAQELNMSEFTREGVYVHLSGPSYETPAECRFLKLIGADAVGMSTAPEVTVAIHCGMKVLGEWTYGNGLLLSFQKIIKLLNLDHQNSSYRANSSTLTL